jgi:two-component system chemotaxis response regulator CheB
VTRVLVVDDSAVAREVLSAVLRRDGFDVEIASGASMALQRLDTRRPDVMLLDLEMPGMGGLDLLERVMRTTPLPIVVCSGIAQPGAAAAIRALELGAVEVIPKPTGGIRAILESDDVRVSQVVRAASAAKTRRLRAQEEIPTEALLVVKVRSGALPWAGNVVVIGASTGGTEALRTVLSSLPADAPPIVVVQHMPGAFTSAFAARLDGLCRVHVREAQDGDALVRGDVLIAPGGRHVELVRGTNGLRLRVLDGLPVSGHRPSVDVLFRSAARTLGPHAVGALLTGMGSDGAAGLHLMREQGAHTIAQDEESCVVFGMPGEAVALGAAAAVLPIEQIGAALMAAASTRAPAIRRVPSPSPRPVS